MLQEKENKKLKCVSKKQASLGLETGVDQQCQETEEVPNEEEFKAHNN